MASFETTSRITQTAREAFAYVADYRNAAAWHPSYVSVEQTNGTGPDVGALYAVRFSFYGQQIDLSFEMTECTTDRVVLEGRSRRVNARDELTVRPEGNQCVVHRSSTMSFTGPLRLFDGGLQVAFESICRRAADGLTAEPVGSL